MGERERQQMRAQALGFAYADLDRIRVAPEVRALVGIEVLERLQMVPVKKAGDRLYVAVADPTLVAGFEEIAAITGGRVIPVVAMPDAIAKALASWRDA